MTPSVARVSEIRSSIAPVTAAKTSYPEPLPSGQGTLWAGVRGPKESRLVTALKTWADTLPISAVLTIRRVFVGRVKTAWGTWIEGAPEGTPDYLGHVRQSAVVRRGCTVAIECKRDRYAKLSPAQIAYLTDVVDAGGIAIAGRDMSQIEAEFLDAIGMRRSDDGRTLVPYDGPARRVYAPPRPVA